MADLSNIIITPLKRIPTVGGDVLHAMRAVDRGFEGFGEVYFSLLEPCCVKAWRRHKRMTLNLVVPIGYVRVVCHLDGSVFRTEEVGENNYVRITIPALTWVGFQSLTTSRSLILNIADLEHQSEEVERCSQDRFDFNWRI